MAGAAERRSGGRGERGQATVELIAGVPALLLAACLALQLLAAGFAVTLADGAAEAGALALASGHDAAPAVREALPGWARDRSSVRVDGGRVTVSVRPPSPLGLLSDRLALDSSAWVRRPR
jgi:pilus assembly protein CpaE